MTTTIPSRLSDGELVAEVARLAGCEREASASLVAHLAELYGRRLHERAGYASLFTYCTDALRLSEHEAYDRMRAAKVTRLRVVWGVYNNSHQLVATYEYPRKDDAMAHAAKLTADKKNTHFVQPVKEPIEEKKEE